MMIVDYKTKHDDHGHDDGEHSHGSDHGHDHGHTHGMIDPSIISTERGIWAVKWSFVGLALTATFQGVVVIFTGSVALLADTIHNLGDAVTTVPLFIAFLFARRKPNERFTYGYGRVEDLAGVFIVLMILASAVVAGYQSILRLMEPQPISFLWAVVVASIVGFAGNEVVALFRIKVGREIGSAALVADGYHARTDGLTSLAVLFGAIGVWLGFPLADPIVGLLISAAILKIVWDSAKLVFTRMLGGVDSNVVGDIREAVRKTPNVLDATDVRVQWFGHQMHCEVSIAVASDLTVIEAHKIAVETRNQLMKEVNYLASATIHVDPAEASGERFHTAEQVA